MKLLEGLTETNILKDDESKWLTINKNMKKNF